MRSYSIFTNILTELLRYSKKNDSATSTYKDLVEIQELETRVNNCFRHGYLNYNEYRILVDTCCHIKAEMKAIVKLNQEVKAIEKRIRKGRFIPA